ncbi:J domain-containing protein [Flavobacterium sp. I-STPA6A]|uniref:J domain-containing protein n=1 Tax=Flavobacterium sp. I-STPA6A TaxID=2590450 RepID=UPI00131B31AF|nr:DnaJ domain-containing protein [Flavobacterium sp. I-STPA6A]
MKDYYSILEISIEAPIEQVKKAYRQKAIKYHPDKHFGNKYFIDKFIEAKEAYDTLSDINRRVEYDLNYIEYFTVEEPKIKEQVEKEKSKEKDREEEFFYDPYKPFHSYQDRVTNKTPQFDPRINHWGEKLSDDADFFKLPKNIGKIISGYTTLTKKMNPSTRSETSLRYAKSIGVALAISAGIIFGFSVQSEILIAICGIVPLSLALWVANKDSEFKHTNTFIGVNGFAQFKCEGSRDNILDSYEINFKDITDLLRITEVTKRNFQYSNTTFHFSWLKNKKNIKEVNDWHTSEEGNPERKETNYWLNDFAEKYWTVYLLDNMEKELETNGFIEFSLYNFKESMYVKTPYIQLGIGYIKFITNKGDLTYNFNEIKRVYSKGTNLFIEHTNYEKKLFFFESGNKNGIPLLNLSNKQFFFRAMHLLLGYKFS